VLPPLLHGCAGRQQSLHFRVQYRDRVLTRQAGGTAGQYRASKSTAAAPTAEQVNALARLVDYLEAANIQTIRLPPAEENNASDTQAKGVEIKELEPEIVGNDEFYDAVDDNIEDYFVNIMGSES
jgi:hypothetical protein